MISKITLKNFKLFKEATDVELSNITLLTGINGRGKSTVLQSLILMKQSLEYDRATDKIIFNGDNVNLGNYIDVKNSSTQIEENIELTFHYKAGFSIKYLLGNNQLDSLIANVNGIYVEGRIDNEGSKFSLEKDENGEYSVVKEYQSQNAPFPTSLYDLFISDISLALYDENYDCEIVSKTINFSKIHYISADRIGPQLFYPLKNTKHFESVGALGENTITVLYTHKDDQVGENIIQNLPRFFHVNKEELGKTVELQLNFWLNNIFEGGEIKIEPLPSINLLNVTIRVGSDLKHFKPTNVGYGFSYILPILVSGLIAQSGDILLVENPEAHLHPFAQSILSKFLTLVSLNGVQVIIESHSEHILNGLRIPVYDKIVKPEHLNVMYFDKSFENNFKKIEIDENGGIQDWPQNFFDQSTKDLNYLFGI